MYDRMQSFKLENRPDELDALTIKKVIKEAFDMGVTSLILIGGEPFLSPELFELISFAKRCGIRGVTVVTNGTLLSEEIIGKIFDCNLDNLSVSIDAASEDTFARIRGENVFNKVIANINLLNSIKEKQNRISPGIVCVCTIMNQNVEEILEIVSLCKRLKISRIIFQPVVSDNTDQNKPGFGASVFIPPDRYGILDRAVDSLIKYKLSSRENFGFIANSTKHLSLIRKYFRGRLNPRVIPCYSGYNRIQIVQEGKVYFCVNQAKYQAAFGDIKNESLRKIWFSKYSRFCRNQIKRCNFPCLQWCAYRDEFIELREAWQKKLIFK
jgi:MoaA/NifB/PqqE/SkfB family radical SAM enzyme